MISGDTTTLLSDVAGLHQSLAVVAAFVATPTWLCIRWFVNSVVNCGQNCTLRYQRELFDSIVQHVHT